MEQQILQEKRDRTKLVLTNVYNLPAMSGTMKEVSEMLDDPNTNSQRLGRMIGRDQAIATKILSIANSPMYGLRRKVTTIDFAILVLGFLEIKKIVLALSLMESFKNKTDKYLDQKKFWLHSILTGSAAKRVAEDLGYRIGGEAFIAGLLHDLGIPVIHKYFHSSFIEIVTNVETGKVKYKDAETSQLGYNHADIGMFLSEKWNLPIELCDTVQNHHQPSKASENRVLASIVHLADYMTQHLQVGDFYWDSDMELDPAILDILKFSSVDDMHHFIDKYKPLFEDEAKALNL